MIVESGDVGFSGFSFVFICGTPRSPNERNAMRRRDHMRTKKTEREDAQKKTLAALGCRKVRRAQVAIRMYRKKLLDPAAVPGALKYIEDGICLGALPPVYAKKSGRRRFGLGDEVGGPITFTREQCLSTKEVPAQVVVTITVEAYVE